MTRLLPCFQRRRSKSKTEVKNAAVEVKNEAVEVNNEAVEVRNEAVEVNNEAVEVRNEAVEVRNEAVEVNNEAVEVNIASDDLDEGADEEQSLPPVEDMDNYDLSDHPNFYQLLSDTYNFYATYKPDGQGVETEAVKEVNTDLDDVDEGADEEQALTPIEDMVNYDYDETTGNYYFYESGLEAAYEPEGEGVETGAVWSCRGNGNWSCWGSGNWSHGCGN